MDLRIVPAARFGPAAAAAFLELLGGFVSPVVGLATGNTPVPFYAALHREVSHGRASVANTRPFAIDEYLGRPGHPCSNAEFFARHWATIPGAPPVAGFDAAAPDPAAEARRFAGALAAAGGLDLALLGIGLNGHLAFNEPGSGPTSETRVTALEASTRESARACWGEGTPERGLTLGLRELLGARKVLLLASGQAKAAILARALRGRREASCPASYLQAHPALVVVADEAAAADCAGPG